MKRVADSSFSCVGCDPFLDGDDPVEERRRMRRWVAIAVGIVLAGNAMVLELAVNTSETGATTRLALHGWLIFCTLVASLLLGPQLLVAIVRELRARRIAIELLFFSGLVGALIASLLCTFTGRGAAYYAVVIILLVVYALGRQLTAISQRRALRSIQAWRGSPDTCEVLRPDGTTEDRPVASVAVGDSVRVHPGRVIPIDGTIVAGEAYVQQSLLTGEFFAVGRGVGDSVLAGSICVDGTLVVRATAPGDARRIDAIARAVEMAQATPSALVTEADRFVRFFLPVVLVIALATFLGWLPAAGAGDALMHAMAVLLVACPCALGFAAPVTIWSALGRLAIAGLIPRRGDVVERLAAVDTVIFDKTGTLTESRAALVDFAFAEGTDDRAALRRAIAAVQRAADHPVAAAFHALAGGGDVRTVAVENLTILPGRGVAATCRTGGAGMRLVIGSERILETDVQQADWHSLRGRLAGVDRGRAVLVLADGRLAAGGVVDEQPLANARPALEELRELGLRRELLTGDTQRRADGWPVEAVVAGLLPDGKVHHVRGRRGEGRCVLFVGDGVNDAPAMAEADIAVAVGAGAPLALASADLILVEPRLGRIPHAIEFCRRARATIRSNLRLAATYNAVGMALAAAGALHPVTAAVLMTCSSLIVTWRALRLLDEDDGAADEDAAATPALRTAEG